MTNEHFTTHVFTVKSNSNLCGINSNLCGLKTTKVTIEQNIAVIFRVYNADIKKLMQTELHILRAGEGENFGVISKRSNYCKNTLMLKSF